MNRNILKIISKYYAQKHSISQEVILSRFSMYHNWDPVLRDYSYDNIIDDLNSYWYYEKYYRGQKTLNILFFQCTIVKENNKWIITAWRKQ